ncbi:hypothetical protein QEN19_002857 [Hanseniaspora menglaensis]
MSAENFPAFESVERNVYTNEILTQKVGDEKEALELVKLKMTSSRLYNEQLVKLFKQLSIIKRNHYQQLKKLFADNENINNIVFNNLVKENGYDIGPLTEIFSEGELLGNGFNKNVYQAILDELKTEMNHTAKFEKVLNEKFITSLDNYDTNNLQTKETWNLLGHLLSAKGNSAQWETNGPLLYQMFESSDVERLNFLKQTLLDFEVLVGQYEVALTNKNQSTYNKIDKFSVEEEIQSFASFAATKNFSGVVKQSYASSQNSSLAADVRHTSSSTVLKHDLMHANFTNSSTKGKITSNSDTGGNKKEKKKLRSKFGTIFGKKNKNKDTANNSKDDLSEKENNYLKNQPRLSRRPSNIAEVSNAIISEQIAEEPGYNNKALPKAPKKQHSPPVENMSDAYVLMSPKNQSNPETHILPTNDLEQRIHTPTEHDTLQLKSPEAPKPRKTNKRVQSQLFTDLNVSARESVYLEGKTLEPQRTADESAVTNFVHPNVVDSPIGGESNADVTLVSQKETIDFSTAVFNSSVAEVVNFIRVPTDELDEDNEPVYKEKIDVVGEIALSIPSSLAGVDLASQKLTLSLDNAPTLNIDNIIYNHELLTPSQHSENSYEISEPNNMIGKSVGLFKYQISNSDADNNVYIPPVTMHSLWNHEDTKSSMVLSVKNNSEEIISFQTCTISIQILDCQVTQVLSKPNGVFNKKKQKIIWRFNDEVNKLQFKPLEEKKFIVRFMTDKKGKEGKSNIEFSVLGYSGAKKSDGLLAVNVISPSGEKLDMNTVNSLVSGKYYTF